MAHQIAHEQNQNRSNKEYPKRCQTKKIFDETVWDSSGGHKPLATPQNKQENKEHCKKCNRLFKNKTGLIQHQKKCLALKEGESFLTHRETKSYDFTEKDIALSQPTIEEVETEPTTTNSSRTPTNPRPTSYADAAKSPPPAIVSANEHGDATENTAAQQPSPFTPIQRNAHEVHQHDENSGGLPQQHCHTTNPKTPIQIRSTQAATNEPPLPPPPPPPQQKQQQKSKPAAATKNKPNMSRTDNQTKSKSSKATNAKPKTTTPPTAPIPEGSLQTSQSVNENDSNTELSPIETAYEEMAKWRRNLFTLPKGNIGKKFIDEMTKLINRWSSTNEEEALTLLMVMPNLLLQRTSKSGKARENKDHLRRRMELWENHKFSELMHEGKCIQQRLAKSQNRQQTDEDIVKSFRNHMLRGNINAALRLLNNTSNKGILPITKETIKQLHEKHPVGEPLHEDMLLHGPIKQIHHIVYEDMSADLVQKVALKTKGAAGPSSFDADDWRSVLGSRVYGTSSSDLCVAIANMAKSLCTENRTENGGISALMACRLIPLDKDPGLRPIGIGEVLRRIIGKMVVHVLKPELQEGAGDLQMCVGQEGGCEAGVHAMHEIFQDEETHGIIQVDANNAFNTINRNMFLHNIQFICPEVSTYIRNCYLKPARLFVVGGIEIKSEEGTTQGDPTAMPTYALGILPLLICLSEPTRDDAKARQAAYADDLTGSGTIDELKIWWDLVIQYGPYIGYYAKPSKSWLIVKEEHLEYASMIFAGTGLQITTEGQRHLGAVIGSELFKDQYVTEKINGWIEELEVLGKIAKVEPHIAYCAYVFGLQHRYTYLLRTIPNISEQLQKLDEAINVHFIGHLVNGYKFNELERRWFSLPPRLGGLGINIPSELADVYYQNSRKMTEVLVERIINQHSTEFTKKENNSKQIKAEIRDEKRKREEEKMQYVNEHLNPYKHKVFDAITEKGASNWLNALPLKEHDFYLDKQTFWDTIHLRYGINLSRLPTKCVCSANFTVEHALTCKKGGFINIRHNEIRDFTAELLSEVCNDVAVEPLLTPLTGETFHYKSANTEDHARLDVSARGVWIKGSKAFCDVRVFNPLAQSYSNQTLKSAHKSNENSKKREYAERVTNVEHGSFTPLVFSCLGGMSTECAHFYNRIADKISEKRNITISKGRTWMRTKLSFCLLRSTHLCIRGSRTKKQFLQEPLADTNINMAMVDAKLDKTE